MSQNDTFAPDREQLERLRADLGSETLAAVLTQCRTESTERMAALRDALARGDVAAAAREAHTLAGLQRSTGLPALGDAFATLERSLETGALPGAETLDSLATALADAHDAARDLLTA